MEEFRIVLADACKIVKESSRKRVISGADEDGRVMVEFSEPVGGRRVKMLTPDEINGMLYKEETPESPVNAEEAMAEETEPPTAGQEESGESALERIPKDAQTGEPQYTQTDAPTAWDAIVEQTEGDEDMARSVVDSTVRDKEAALKKLESSNPKPGATVAEKIAAAKEHKAAIEAARQELEQWKAIAEVENIRKAEAEERAEEEAKAKAEEERTALKGVNLSEEKDENGNSFVVSSDGTTTFGEVRDKSGLPAAPIKLSVGYQDKNGSGYGLTHIEANHGAQIKKEGFASVEDFVSYVAKNYDENNIKVGKRRTGGSITYLLQVTGKHDNTLFIELSRDGSYWNVNSAGVFRKGYSDKKETVAKTEPQQPSNAISERALQSADQSNGILPASPNGKPTVSASKVSESSETKQEKAEKSISAKVKEASADVNTEPTEAQKEAGNYKKGHVQVGTFDITIEQPEGSIRRGTDADGKQWESKMHNTYGYFRGTEGVDGDHIDVFLSNDMDGWNGAQVFVVDQYNPDGTFDEHKVMLGFNDADDAKSDYLANYAKGWENGRRIDVSAVNLEDFEKWIASSHRKTKPFSEYSSVNKETVANTPAEEEAKADAAEEAKAKVKEASAGEMQDIEAEIKRLEEIKDYPGADKKIVQSEIDRLKAEKEAKAKSKNVQGTNKTGAFGTIYTQFKGKAKEAIAFLLEKKEGEAVGALHHKDIGDIDLVWGNEKAGLQKIAKKHPEVLDNLQEIIGGMHVVSESPNRIKLESATHFAVVSKEFLGKERGKWLLTTYEKKKDVSGGSIDIAPEPKTGKQNGTAPLQDTVSASKVSESPETKQEKKEKSEEPKSNEKNGVDDAKIDAALEALDKGREKAARRLASELTNKELSKARSKAKSSVLLEYEWQWRAQNRGDVSLHDWMLENQYVEPVKRVSGTFRITDYTALKDSPYAERLGGVYHDNSGFAVATDARILVASKDDFDPKLKGKVIGKDGTVSESKFPDWQKAIPPAKETKSSNIDVEDLRKFVSGVLRANKRAYISLRFPDGTVEVFKANRLNLMLRAMKQLGTSELLYTKDGMKLVAKSEKGTAMLMGLVSVEDELVEANGYAYPGNTVLYHRGEVVSELSPGERVLRDAVIDRLRESGMEVITDEEAGQRVLDEANGKAKLSAKKRRALETASLGKTPRSLTVVSSADGAKEIATIAENSTNKATGISDAFANVQTNLENLARVYAEKVTNKTRGFITDLSKALKLTQHEASNYGSFALPNGETLAIRISNHNARVSNFDKNDENNGISIVISSHKNKGLNNDGKAHIIEYFYHRRAIENATGKPLADIVKSIEQALYSGEFKDTTGLAQRQEVNAETIREHRVYHGSGADFDAFDHSHMGEGEGAQAYGWGTYVTEVEGIGRTYAEGARKKPTYLFGGKEMTTDEFHDYVLGEIGDRNENMLNDFMYNLERHGVTRAKDILKKGDLARYKNMFYQSIGDTRNYAEGKIKAARTLLSLKGIRIRKPKSHLYTVEIPNDNGGNYFDWVAQTGSGLVTRIREALRADEGLNGLYEGRKSELNAELEKFAPGMPFYETYAQLGDLLGSDKAASELLSSLGFAGIKYPADNMRGGREDGAKNYVIFNEKDARITDQVRFFRTESGEAYGFTVGGKIYIDPKIANTETPIHEYAHLWAAALRGQNPKEWQNIVELMKGTSVWDEVKKRYPELNTGDDIADEVLATYSGRRGAERLREEQRKIAGGKGGVFEKAEAISALERVKQALRKFWKSVADFLHIHYKSAEEVADRVMKDLLDGVDPGKHFNSRMDESKSERIEKLRESKPVEITGDEYKGKYELNRESAKEWLKNNLRGEYRIKDTGETVELRKDGIQKVTSHSMGNEAHLKSLAAIPQMIENSIFIDEVPNEKNNGKYDRYRYYVCGLKIGGEDYTAKITIGVKGGYKYYDHSLTQIEKGSLLDNIDALSTTYDDKGTTLSSVGKDSRLLSILQVKDEKKPNRELYRAGSKELRDGRKVEFVRKPTATYNALARHLQAEGIKPDMHEARTGSRYMSFEKDGVQWKVRSSDHTKPEYFGEAQKPVELTYYKDKQGEENLSVSVDLGTSGYNIEDMKALMAEIDRLKNDAGEVKESFDRGVASDEVMERYPLLSQALGVKSENEVRAEEEAREHAEEARKHAEEARKQEMRSAVEDMAGKLHLNNVDIVDKPAGRGAGRRERAKGMFERSTGRITINIGNCADKRDAVVTLLHEAVAHHGLRKLFGENFETFLDNVYNSANAEIRRIIDKHSRRYGGDKRTATEEYMASLAERTDFENAKKSGWWQRIKDFFLKMLEKIGLKGFKGEDLSDNELRYVLWRSYENLKSGGKDTVFSAADDLAKQSELNVGEFAPDAKKTARDAKKIAPDAKKTAPEENAEEVNERFNNELTRYQSGDMDKNEMLHLGKPQGVMRTFLPNLPIVMRQRVIKKGSEKKHEVDVSAIMNMPQHLSSPIFVFQRSEDTIGVLTDMRDRNGKNVCVAIELKRQIQQGAEYLEVNDVRSFHGREFKNIVEPIANNKALKWVDKEKGLAYLSSASQPVQQEIDKQVLDTATKVVKDFVNPKSESKNDALFRDGAAKDYEKAQARETYERRVSTGMFQSREAIQDSMLSLKVAMDAIEEATAGKAKRIEDYDGFENAYLGENRLSSVNQAESAAFAHLLIRPMMEEVNRLAPTAKDRAELIDYMFAKHGLERNAYMRRLAAEKKLAEYKKQNPGTAKTAADFIDAERDYAGLTTLTGKADVSAAEAEAQRMAAEYEKTTHFMEFGMRYMYVERKSVR